MLRENRRMERGNIFCCSSEAGSSHPGIAHGELGRLGKPKLEFKWPHIKWPPQDGVPQRQAQVPSPPQRPAPEPEFSGCPMMVAVLGCWR